MYLLYDILLHLSLIFLLPYFLFKMIFTGKYRKGIIERFGFIDGEKLKNLSMGNVVWFHAVSVGETKAVLPLIKRLKQKHPGVKVVFSTVTATGNAVAVKEGSQWIDSLVYFPLDFYWVVNRVVRKLKPKAFVVVEKEIWPNILKILKKNKIPVMAVNGSISDRSFKRYQLFGFFFKRIFKDISCFLCQTKKDGDKAIALGIEPARVAATGNIKFDIEPPQWNPVERDALLKRLNITAGDKILVAGSTHAGEEEIVLDVFKRLKLVPEMFNRGQGLSGLKLIIAPRHPERFKEVENLIKDNGFSFLKRSEPHTPHPTSHIPKDVILLDTIGELCNFYSISTIAFVGGTLVDIGGHNLLEPAFYKKPVIYGPYLKSYVTMADMLETAGGGIRVNNGEDFLEKVKQLLVDEAYRHKAGNAAYNVVLANKGATEKCLKALECFVVE